MNRPSWKVPSGPEANNGWELATARRLGDLLVERAIWHGERCTWFGYDMEHHGADWTTVYRTLDESLYSGTAGVSLFLATLWSFAREPEYARTAMGALRQTAWLLNQKRNATPHGFFSGVLGCLWAMSVSRARLGLTEPKNDMAWSHLAEIASMPANEFDLVDGLAGSLVAVLALGRGWDDAQQAHVGYGLADRLLDSAEQGPGVGLSWTSQSSAMHVRQPLVGLAHGASSASLALLEWWKVTREARYREAALNGFRYERQWFSRRHGNWPDLREPMVGENSAGDDVYPLFWCHGAPGIGLARLRAFQLTGDFTLRAEGNAALLTCRHAARRVGHNSPQGTEDGLSNASVCHGLFSLADLLLHSWRQDGVREDLKLARHLGRVASDRARESGEWACGVPGGGESPGLMLGLSGIGMIYLGLHAPARAGSVGLPWLGVNEGTSGDT